MRMNFASSIYVNNVSLTLSPGWTEDDSKGLIKKKKKKTCLSISYISDFGLSRHLRVFMCFKRSGLSQGNSVPTMLRMQNKQIIHGVSHGLLKHVQLEPYSEGSNPSERCARY